MQKEKKKNCRPLAGERPAAAVFFLSFRLSFLFFFFVLSTKTFCVKVVYMVLGSSYLSARKILVLGPSTTLCM